MSGTKESGYDSLLFTTLKTVQRFKGENFERFAYRFMDIAKSVDSEQILTGTSLRPRDNPEEWDRKNKEIRQLLVALLDDSQIDFAINARPADSSKALWDALLKVYRPTDDSSVTANASQWIHTTQENASEEQTTSKFIDVVTNRRKQMKECAPKRLDGTIDGEKLVDIISSSVLLDGLPAEFIAIVSALRVDKTSTFDSCKDQILSQSNRMVAPGGGTNISGGDSSAFWANGNFGQNKSGNNGQSKSPTDKSDKSSDKCPHCARVHPGGVKECWVLYPHKHPKFWDEHGGDIMEFIREKKEAEKEEKETGNYARGGGKPQYNFAW